MHQLMYYEATVYILENFRQDKEFSFRRKTGYATDKPNL